MRVLPLAVTVLFEVFRDYVTVFVEYGVLICSEESIAPLLKGGKISAGRPAIVFCNDWLLGTKYAGFPVHWAFSEKPLKSVKNVKNSGTSGWVRLFFVFSE
jgi:hypothetical protein